MINDHVKLQQLFEMNKELENLGDVDGVLEKILDIARRLLNAESGSIYVVIDGGYLEFRYAQNEILERRLPKGRKLIYSTFAVPINHESISGYVADTGETVNIPDVYNLEPRKVPYRFDSSFDKKADYRSASMLTIPLKNNRKKIIGVMQLINARDDDGTIIPFSMDDLPIVRIFAQSAAMALERAGMTRMLLMRMIRMAELRDPSETGSHVNRVGIYAAELYEAWARKKGICSRTLTHNKDILRMAAMLHDVGKVGIEDGILKKPGKLTHDEYETMKHHAVMGARLFHPPQSALDEMARQIALNHHEKWDGNGYPGHVDPERDGAPLPGFETRDGKARGKKGEEIPIWGRVVAVADVYDALLSKRVYKEAWAEADVIAELKRCAGNHFDPEVIEVFLSCKDTLRRMGEQYRE